MSDLGGSFDWPACPAGEAGERERLRQALGDAFVADALRVEAAREGVRISGWVGLPTFNKPNALSQYFFVNRRAVRDRLLSGALRAAALDFIPRDRHCVAVLFVDCAPSEVDVNVHPAKAEVRFRDSRAHRARCSSARCARPSQRRGTAPRQRRRRHARRDARARLSRARRRAELGLARFARRAVGGREPLRRAGAGRLRRLRPVGRRARVRARRRPPTSPRRSARRARRCTIRSSSRRRWTASSSSTSTPPTSASSTRSSSASASRTAIARQILLSPLVVDLEPRAAAALAEQAGELEALGLVVEPFGPGAALLREAPALIDGADMAALVRDLAEDLAAEDGAQTLERRLDHRLATIACHHSVRAGRPLKPGRDERAAARDGGDARRRPVQPRPPDLRRAEARRHRAAVREEVRAAALRKRDRIWRLTP